MDLHFSPEDEAFRRSLRDWLEANLPPGWNTPAYQPPEDFDEWVAFLRDLDRRLYEGGWAGIHWPREYGGRGATLVQQLIFAEESARYNLPQTISYLGKNMLGPTLMQYGTEAQKRRFLPKILSAEEIWCQGYSEPNAGSDLASLRTRGTIQGNKIIINGHKIWTTYAQYADWCFLLCRTDPDAPKHMGITFVLVNMRQPGVTVKPLRQITGDAEFNEIFFDNVEADVENVVGEINGGWKVAMALLGHERGTVYITRSMQSRQDVERLIRLARQVPRNGRPASEDPVIRQRLMEVYADMEGFRWLVYGYVTQLLRTGAPGPESSMLKLFWSEAYQRLTELAVEILGPSGQLMKGAPRAYANGQWTYDFLYSKMRTIAGGTSEIQRNVIGERVLGLPR